jgi:hypothetical protein
VTRNVLRLLIACQYVPFMSDDQPGHDHAWNSFVEKFHREAAETKAAAGRANNEPPEQPRRARTWPRNLLLAVIAGAVTAAVVQYQHLHAHRAVVATALPGKAAPAPAKKGEIVLPEPATAQIFPASVTGSGGTVYTRVGMARVPSCTTSDMVAPTLAGLIVQSHGCSGLEVALYKDADKDQFNLAVFTMKDPVDAVTIIGDLSSNLTDYEVGTEAPPPGSGLPTLSATSGLVQSFAGVNNVMIVAIGQWSDGRSSDYQQLENLTTPLMNGVSTLVRGQVKA